MLFETAAEAYGERLLGVVLSGANADGAAGLKAVAEAGGIAAVQSLETSEMIAMPAAALQAAPDSVEVNLAALADFLRAHGEAGCRIRSSACWSTTSRKTSLALEALLRGDDREIFKAASGPAALELLLVHDFALALLDIHMPTMDGFELAELMRGTERSKHIPIIFITAASPNEPLPMFRGYESGAVDVLFKPINPEILRQKAADFLPAAPAAACSSNRRCVRARTCSPSCRTTCARRCRWCTPRRRCCSIRSTSSRRNRCASSTNASAATSSS